MEKFNLEKDRHERHHTRIQNWGEQHPEFHTKEHMRWLRCKQNRHIYMVRADSRIKKCKVCGHVENEGAGL